MINIAVIEDELELRQVYSEFFAQSEQFDCVLAVDTVEKFLKFHRDFLEIKVILLDVNIYGVSSIPMIPLIKQREPDAEIILYTVVDDYDSIFQAICLGATGYLLKDISLEGLEQGLKDIMRQNGALLSPVIAKKIMSYFSKKNTPAPSPDSENNQLNDKEYKITTLLIDGHEYEKIASFMDLSVDGVRYYIKSIYKKLQVNSRKELVKKFVTNRTKNL